MSGRSAPVAKYTWNAMGTEKPKRVRTPRRLRRLEPRLKRPGFATTRRGRKAIARIAREYARLGIAR